MFRKKGKQKLLEGSIELNYVKFICSASDFFIRCKGDPYRTMFDLGMTDQIIHGRDYFGNPGFIVCSKQSGSIRGDQLLSDIMIDYGEFYR